MSYDHKTLEKKWQKKWAEDGLHKTQEGGDKPKCYVLDMFPYPSGEGLHVGHPKGYIATDIYSRYKRMNGFNILHPMGWDAFGLPAENFAIANKVHPRAAVEKNIAHFKEQLEKIGFNYDWDREINTTDPKYYKWTQWIFLKLFEKGLAYQSNEPINWCPSCKTGLSNEDLDEGTCERCGTPVEKKTLPQWVLKITDYADRLLHDLELLPKWPESIKESQRNWIGRSEGAELEFVLVGSDKKIKVFTTRPDTLFGATYLVLGPEHPLLSGLKEMVENWDEVAAYVHASIQKAEIERTAEGKEKTGVELKGIQAINPANQEKIPVWVADYVLGHYGTGAIMAVPAHDQRDWEFAKKFNLPALQVICDRYPEPVCPVLEEAFTKDGHLVGSGQFDGLTSEEAKQKITDFVSGKMVVQYKLRDWVFSRQRYWGEPIPIIHCEQCGAVPVPESDLPVMLPEVEAYEPSGTGESPLATISEWVNVPCPTCGGAGKRETNTMPQWAGSSWYYLRYMDPHNDAALVSPEKENYWAPVDMYVGGAEHATRHLIYARFWHKFLNDSGVVSTREPFEELHSVGLIIAEDGRKMSKRFGNVINPDTIVDEYGADTLRIYEMFMGPFENAIAWNTKSLVGSRRFLERVWRLADMNVSVSSESVQPLLHQTIKKVGEDIASFKFNTAIAQLMTFLNALEKQPDTEAFKTFLVLIAPFAPHITEEAWAHIGKEGSIHTQSWPSYDPNQLQADRVTVAVQVNGKTRAAVEVSSDSSEEEQQQVAKAAVADRLNGTSVSRVVVIKGRLVNFVTEEA